MEFPLSLRRLVPALFALGFFACDREVILGVETHAVDGGGGVHSGGTTAGGSGGLDPGEGGLGAASPLGPICGDGIPEGENEQCDERGGTQTCTVDCQFRNRVTDGLILLYTFEESTGSQVFDRSGYEAPLNLAIPGTGATAWNSASLDLTAPVLIESTSPALKLLEAVQASSEFTLEAWVEPATAEQDGPARILTVSNIEFRRNLTLAQDGANLHARLRTSATENNGFPEFIAEGVMAPELIHLVYLHRADGSESLYVNNVERATRSQSGDFSTWDASMQLGLGAEFNEDLESRDFLGTMHLIAMYSRALSPAEVLLNFEDGP